MVSEPNSRLIQVHKIDTLKSLEFLDLRIPDCRKYKIVENNSQIICNFEGFKHILHSEDKQLNSIIDILINFGNNIARYKSLIEKSIQDFSEKIEILQKEIIVIRTNQDYIKDLNNTSRQTSLEVESIELVRQLKRKLENLDKDFEFVKRTLLEIKYGTVDE